MDIEGSYTFSAPLELVWMVMLDPLAIKQALPGCESFDQERVHDYTARLRIEAGPLKDLYYGRIHLTNVAAYRGYDLVVDARGSHGPIIANGRLVLEENAGITTLRYAGNVEVPGPVAAESPRLVRTTANALIRQYMAGIARQIGLQTQVYTTAIDSSIESGAGEQRLAGTVTMQDWVERLRRDRRITAIVLLLILLLSLMSVGGVMIVLAVFRWLNRYFRGVVKEVVLENSSPGDSGTAAL